MVISEEDLLFILKKIQRGNLDGFTSVIVPVDSSPQHFLYLNKLNDESKVSLDKYRTIDPIKILFYRVREKIFPFDSLTDKNLVVGVKACDLQALKLLDKALLSSGFTDKAYEAWRKNTTIVSCDCTEITPVCHCNLLDGHPFAISNFEKYDMNLFSDSIYDMNLSKTGDKYVISVGSAKGEALLNLMKNHAHLSEITENIKQKVREQREKVMLKLAEQNLKYDKYGSFESLKIAAHDEWIEESKECVGCTACTNICPTCYCLILNDESARQEFIKVRSYDSCQLRGYARVAGGATPRPNVFQRFRNRYLCKFLYMKNEFGFSGCTGCGRCIEAESTKIDIRSVVQRIISNNESIYIN